MGYPTGLRWFCAIVAGTTLCFASGGGASGAEWRVGLASVKITPDEPLRMSGYASRTSPSQGVAIDLFAKAMAVEDGEGNQAVLITADLIGFRADFAEPTRQRIAEQSGLPPEQILFNASHTHTGPTLGLDPEKLDFPADQAAATVAYSRGLQDRLVRLVSDALERLEPAELSWGTGVASFVMNRREFTDRGVVLGVNPRGLVDRSVPVLRIDSPEGELRGVLFGAACHNTTLTGNDLDISGDFAGYAQLQVEMARQGVQAMFMQGCGGDANPYPRGSEELASLHGRALGAEVLRVLSSELQPVRGELRTSFAMVDLPLEPPLSTEELESDSEPNRWRRAAAEKAQRERDSGKSPSTVYPAPFTVWQFGDDLTLVGLPGEVVVEYVALIEEAIGPRRLWVAAYCNDVFGYVPSSAVINEGGYETRGLYAGGVGMFAPQVEQVVVETVRNLARRVERPTDETDSN